MFNRVCFVSADLRSIYFPLDAKFEFFSFCSLPFFLARINEEASRRLHWNKIWKFDSRNVFFHGTKTREIFTRKRIINAPSCSIKLSNLFFAELGGRVARENLSKCCRAVYHSCCFSNYHKSILAIRYLESRLKDRRCRRKKTFAKINKMWLQLKSRTKSSKQTNICLVIYVHKSRIDFGLLNSGNIWIVMSN